MMKYIFDQNAFLYMLEQFPRHVAPEMWQAFVDAYQKGTIISHRETQKLFDQAAVEEDSLKWSKENSSIFKMTTSSEAILLGKMMDNHVFDFLATPQLLQRKMPQAIPFMLCMAKDRNGAFVYRKNTDINYLAKLKKVCDNYNIMHMEIEDCLMSLPSI